MSSRHPNIRAWKRDPMAGCYVSEPPSWKLRVCWCSPNTVTQRGHFRWEARRVGGTRHNSDKTFNELELAMADAEHCVRNIERRRAIVLARHAEQLGADSSPPDTV